MRPGAKALEVYFCFLLWGKAESLWTSPALLSAWSSWPSLFVLPSCFAIWEEPWLNWGNTHTHIHLPSPLWGGLGLFPQSALRAIVFFNCYDDQIHLLLGMEGGWKGAFLNLKLCDYHLSCWVCPDLGYSERERECTCSQVRGQATRDSVVLRMVPRPRDTAMVSEVRITKWFIYEKVWCVMYIYWLEYLRRPWWNVVEILMHKKTRKRKDHRWFHKRRRGTVPSLKQTNREGQCLRPVLYCRKNQIHSPFTNAKFISQLSAVPSSS